MSTLFNDFPTITDSHWQPADWSNNGVFLNAWEPSQISSLNGNLIITLAPSTPGATSYVSGEYRTLDRYSYGYYEISLKASSAPGTVTGFFTYTGPSEGTRHDEIDIEILGDDPGKMQVNYWSNGIEHPTTINLGFNAASQQHVYAFDWRQDAIKWYVDGILVHTETGSNGALPTTPGKLMLNLWATTHTGGWSSDAYNGQTTQIEADYIKYDSTSSTETETVTPSVTVNSRGEFVGSDASDLLSGSAGGLADKMFGGKGDDIYVVDNIGDRVTESYGAGTDEVRSGIHYKLGRHLENLTLQGTAEKNLKGTGNELSNILTGDDGNNQLDGDRGVDSYIGGKGDDIYLLDDLLETNISESPDQGNDTVRLKAYSAGSYTLPDNIENLLLTGYGSINVIGNTVNNLLAGNAKANRLDGGGGDDSLIGGLGNDTLSGGTGSDAFVFNTLPSKTNVDTITDFAGATDKILLAGNIFRKLLTGNGSPDGDLSDNFAIIAPGTTASTVNQCLLYDSTSGGLYYDADGSGSRIMVLVGLFDDGAGHHPMLTANDFGFYVK